MIGKILVVGKDLQHREHVVARLQAMGIETFEADRILKDAVPIVESEKPDLVILTKSRTNGETIIKFCQAVAQFSPADRVESIIFSPLAHKEEGPNFEAFAEEALKAGARECQQEPKNPELLALRVRNQLIAVLESRAVIRCGRLIFDRQNATVKVEGDMDAPEALTNIEVRLLLTLMEAYDPDAKPNLQRTAARADLLQKVFGVGEGVETRTLDTHIKRLRGKLGPRGESIIETKRTYGYAFNPNALRK